MAHDHTFDCQICGAHLDSQHDLDTHNRAEHDTTRPTSGQNAQAARTERPDLTAQSDRNPRDNDPRTPNTQERL